MDIDAEKGIRLTEFNSRSILICSLRTNAVRKGMQQTSISCGLQYRADWPLLTRGGNRLGEGKNVNSKPTEKGWPSSGYLALDIPLLPWMQYMWCLYGQNGLRDPHTIQNSLPAFKKKSIHPKQGDITTKTQEDTASKKTKKTITKKKKQ